MSLRKSHAVRDPRLKQRSVQVFDEATNAGALIWLGERLRDGTLTPRVGIRLPMSEAAQAHRLVEQGGMRGRVVLMFDGDPRR